VPWRWLTAGQGDQLLFDFSCDGHFVWSFEGPTRMECRLKTFFHELLSDTVDGGKTHAQRCGNGFVGIFHAFRTRIRLQQNTAMEQCTRGPFAR
jgi:hypothetical protein